MSISGISNITTAGGQYDFSSMTNKQASDLANPSTSFEDMLTLSNAAQNSVQAAGASDTGTSTSYNVNSMTNAQLMTLAQQSGMTNVSNWIGLPPTSATDPAVSTASINLNGSPIYLVQVASDPTLHNFPQELTQYADAAQQNGDPQTAAYFNSLASTLQDAANSDGIINVA